MVVVFPIVSERANRANMPDLALLHGPGPGSAVMWIADPKYSEASAYSRADYMEVAERYRDTFKADYVWICEFFARREWFGGRCCEQGDKISLLTEVQPNGEGTRVLKHGLRLLHGVAWGQLVLAIDCSSSFADVLPRLAVGLEALLDTAEAVVCFAGSAREISGKDFAAVQDAAETLSDGTRLSPLVSALKALAVRDDAITDLVLVSDFAFCNSTDELRNELQRLFAHTETAKDEGFSQNWLRITARVSLFGAMVAHVLQPRTIRWGDPSLHFSQDLAQIGPKRRMPSP